MTARYLDCSFTQLLDIGAYHGVFSAFQVVACLLGGGPYEWKAINARSIGIFTNRTSTDPYRGAGRPEATHLVERMVDLVAREIGMDPAEIRRKNFVKSFPHINNFGLVYDSGDYPKTLDRALANIDYAALRKRQEELRAQGRYIGIGFSTYVEICGLGPSAATAPAAGIALVELSMVRVHPTGSVTVSVGTHSHGQSHETTFAQIAADALGVPYDSVEIRHGDTGDTPFGYGTYGSRSLAVGGMAIMASCHKVVEKASKLAAHAFEASEEDIVVDQGRYFVRGNPGEAKVLAELAFASYGAGLPEGMEQGSRRCRTSTRRTSSGRSAATSARWRWIPRPAPSPSIATSRSTTAATSSTRWSSTASSTAGSPRASPRRSSKRSVRRRDRADAQRHHARLPDPDDGRDAEVRAGPHRDSEPDQRAGGQGHRRSRDHRVERRGDQRDHRRAGSLRHQARGDAGATGSPLVDDQGGTRMITAAFEYARPGSVEEAQSLLNKYGSDAKVIAGGQSLIPLMRLRLSQPTALVDIQRIPGLNQVRRDNGTVEIGALMRHVDIQRNATLRETLPILVEMANDVGDNQVRNLGTIGGVIAHGDSAGDYNALALMLDAEIVTNKRRHQARDFYRDIFTTALEPDEVVTAVRFPVSTGRFAYTKFRRRLYDWAIAGVAVQQTGFVLAGRLREPREDTASGQAVERRSLAARPPRRRRPQSGADIDPTGDVRATAEYKRHLAQVLTARTLQKATMAA